MPIQTMSDTALEYLRHGWSVIPLEPQGKRPLIRWQDRQLVRADVDTVESWWLGTPAANLGVVTGQISGLVVLDLDGAQGRRSVRDQELPATPIAQTGRGWHYYFSHPGHAIHNAAGLLPGVDLRGDGGYVVAPPSIHQSGNRYEWMLDPFDTPLAPLPDWLLRTGDDATARRTPRRAPGNWPLLLRTPVPEGRRNQTLTRVAGYLLRASGIGSESALELAFAWNRAYCQPPLDRDEIVTIFYSIAARESARRLRREESR